MYPVQLYNGPKESVCPHITKIMSSAVQELLTSRFCCLFFGLRADIYSKSNPLEVSTAVPFILRCVTFMLSLICGHAATVSQSSSM